jgi:hypothetical protein
MPYVYMGLGYNYTELDRELYTIYNTHSLALEPGAGVSFQVIDSFWMGLETSVIPIILGNDEISGSLIFHALVSFELKI